MYRVLEALRLGGAGLDRRARRQSRQRQRFGKAFIELTELGLIDRMPRLAIINAAGANTLYQLVREARPALEHGPAGPAAHRQVLPA